MQKSMPYNTRVTFCSHMWMNYAVDTPSTNTCKLCFLRNQKKKKAGKVSHRSRGQFEVLSDLRSLYFLVGLYWSLHKLRLPSKTGLKTKLYYPAPLPFPLPPPPFPPSSPKKKQIQKTSPHLAVSRHFVYMKQAACIITRQWLCQSWDG